MDYKKSYHLLFNAITDALEAMEQQNFGQARQTLVYAQIKAESMFLEGPNQISDENSREPF